MSNEPRTDVQPLQEVALGFVEKVLPRGLREECMAELRRVCNPVGDWLKQISVTVVGAYRVQMIAGFNKACFLFELAAGIYIFSAAAAQAPGSIVPVVLPYLAILRFRSAYTFPGRIKKRLKKQKALSPAPSQGSMDSLGDAVWAAIMILVPQSVMLHVSPSLTLAQANAMRGTFLMIPILGCIRMAFRPRFDLKMPFQGSNLTAEQIYRRTWGLTGMWVLAFVYVVVGNPDSLPGWVPEHDFLRAWIPLHIFIYWFRLQQNPLIRRDHIETIVEDWEKKKKARKRERLIKGLKKGEPFYRAYVVMQGMLFLYLAIPLATNLWPWLAHGETSLDWFRISVDVVTLVTLVWTWNYAKDANRVAAEAMQREIDSMEWGRPFQPKLKWWKRWWFNVLRRVRSLPRWVLRS